MSRFSADRQVGQQAELLVDDADAGLAHLGGARVADLLAVDQVVAAVAPDGAGEDLDQRALAGPVLAGEAHDLAGAELERDAVQRLDRPVGLRRRRCSDTTGAWRASVGSGLGGDRGAHGYCAFAVGGFSSGLTVGRAHVAPCRATTAPGSRFSGGWLPTAAMPGLDDALVAEEVRVLDDERVDRAVGERRVLLRVGVEGDDRDAVGGLVVLDGARGAGARGVVVGEDPDEARVGRQHVVDLAGRGVEVVVVVARAWRRAGPGRP